MNHVGVLDGVAGAPGGEVDEAFHAGLRHRGDEVFHEDLLEVVLLEGARAERGDDGVLVGAGALEGGGVAGFALGDAQMVVLQLVARRVSDEGGDFVASREELVDEVRAREAGGTDDEDLHAPTIRIC